ncbi:hypothetical protein GJ496_005452 [Pomphorhynchus laevis]|nr:hypothetical protein GJ496_005452 [Pomphorhynchus laevis]
MSNTRPTKRKRGRERYQAVTSDVISLGKPRKVFTTDEKSCALPILTHVSSRLPSLKELNQDDFTTNTIDPQNIRSKLNLMIESCLSIDQFTENLSQLTVKMLCKYKTDHRFTIEEYERIIVLILELGILVRKCNQKYIMSILNCTCAMLPIMSTKLLPITVVPDKRCLALASTGIVDAGLRRIHQKGNQDFCWPVEFIKSYIFDKLLSIPFWTNLLHCQEMCKQLVTYGLNGRQNCRWNEHGKQEHNQLNCSTTHTSITSSNCFGDYQSLESYIMQKLFPLDKFADEGDMHLQDNQQHDNITVEQFNLIADCTVFHAVRHILVFRKLERWLYDPRYGKCAAELLCAVIVNGQLDLDDSFVVESENVTIAQLIRIPIKNQLVHQVMLQSVQILIDLAMDCQRNKVINMYMKECVIYMLDIYSNCSNQDAEFCQRCSLPISIILIFFEFSLNIASECMGNVFRRVLTRPSSSEKTLFVCATILRDLLLLNNVNLQNPEQCLKLIRREMFKNISSQSSSLSSVFSFDYSGGVPKIMPESGSDDETSKRSLEILLFFNLLSLALEIIRSFKDNMSTIVVDGTDFLRKIILTLRADIYNWQENNLDVIAQLLKCEADIPDEIMLRSYQTGFSICCFMNAHIEQLSTVLKELVAEADCASVVHVLMNVGTNEAIILKLLNFSNLKLGKQYILETVEQILRRCFNCIEDDKDRLCRLEISDINSLISGVWTCCQLNNEVVSSICFWRCCFILVFIICIAVEAKLETDDCCEHICTRICEEFPTVRSMLEVLLSNQYMNFPNLTVMRLANGDIDRFNSIMQRLLRREQKQLKAVANDGHDKNDMISLDICNQWPRQLSDIHLSKLKALNHSHHLTDRLLNYRRFLIKQLFLHYSNQKKKNKDMFEQIFTEWAHIAMQFFQVEDQLPIDCLCLYILKYDTAQLSFSKVQIADQICSINAIIDRMEAAIIRKLIKCPISSWSIIQCFMTVLGHDGIDGSKIFNHSQRYTIWKRLKIFDFKSRRNNNENTTTSSEGISRLINFAKLSVDELLKRKVDENELHDCILITLKALFRESDIVHGIKLLEFVIDICSELLSDSHNFDYGTLALISDQIRKRPKFWTFMLQRKDYNLRDRLIKLLEKDAVLFETIIVEFPILDRCDAVDVSDNSETYCSTFTRNRKIQQLIKHLTSAVQNAGSASLNHFEQLLTTPDEVDSIECLNANKNMDDIKSNNTPNQLKISECSVMKDQHLPVIVNEIGDVDIRRQFFFQGDVDFRSWSPNGASAAKSSEKSIVPTAFVDHTRELTLFKQIEEVLHSHISQEGSEWKCCHIKLFNIKKLSTDYWEQTITMIRDIILQHNDRKMQLLLAQRLTDLSFKHLMLASNCNETEINADLKDLSTTHLQENVLSPVFRTQVTLTLIQLTKAINTLSYCKNAKHMQSYVRTMCDILQNQAQMDKRIGELIWLIFSVVMKDSTHRRSLKDLRSVNNLRNLLKSMNISVSDDCKQSTVNVIPNQLDECNFMHNSPTVITRNDPFPIAVRTSKLANNYRRSRRYDDYLCLCRQLQNLDASNGCLFDANYSISERLNIPKSTSLINHCLDNILPNLLQDFLVAKISGNQKDDNATPEIHIGLKLLNSLFHSSVANKLDISDKLNDVILPIMNYYPGLS